MNLGPALEAADSFKKKGVDLPIVIVDVEKCIESEKSKINAMLKEAEDKNSKELFSKAEAKLHNNLKASYYQYKFRDVFGKYSGLRENFSKQNLKQEHNNLKGDTYQRLHKQNEIEREAVKTNIDEKKYTNNAPNTNTKGSTQVGLNTNERNSIQNSLNANEKENSQNTLNTDEKESTLGLGEDKYNYVKHYPKTLKKLESICGSTKNQAFRACMNEMNNKNLELTEWTTELNNLINRFNDEKFEKLLSTIDVKSTNIEQLSKVLEQPNYFDIKNVEELKNYQNTKMEVCDAIINGDKEKVSKYPLISQMGENEQLRFAVLEKLMGLDLKQAGAMYKYQDLDKIDVKDTNEIKTWITAIKKVNSEIDTDKLRKLYNLEPLPERAQNKSILEQEVKSLYMQKYNETLFQPQKGETIPSEEFEECLPKGADKNNYKFIDAGTDFNMIMTAVGAFSGERNSNYAKSWNREITNSKGFSCSYIGNDMLRHVHTSTVYYGFSKMENDSLLLAGSENLGSATNKNELVINNNSVT